jgi:hypothetical protein
MDQHDRRLFVGMGFMAEKLSRICSETIARYECKNGFVA